jgi:hypothetical protein
VLPLLGRAPMAVTGLFRCLALGAAMLAPVVAKAETLQTLYMFKGSPDGRFPFGGVAFDNSGNLYGTTLYNGTTCGGSGCGAVFKLAPPSSGKAEWTETLYPFTGSPQGANPYDSNSRSRHFPFVHGLSPLFRISGGIVKVVRDWRRASQEGKTT